MEPTLETVADTLRQAHILLLEDLRQLEALSTLEAGLTKIRDRLRKTRGHLIAHFQLEEQNGYLDEVRQREPRLVRQINRLAEEHLELLQALAVLLARAETAAQTEIALVAGIREWIVQVRDHELRENDLVQDAFLTDSGTKD